MHKIIICRIRKLIHAARIKTKLFIAILFVFSLLFKASATNYNGEFYTLYVDGEMIEWVNLLDRAKADYKQTKNPLVLEDIIRAQYGLIAYYIGNNEDEKALKEIDTAIDFLEQLDGYYPNQGWVYALNASFQSFKLIINPLRFFFKGPGILNAINKSNELAPNDIDVMFLKANQTFYMPGFLGGDQQKGLDYFLILEKKLITYNIKKDKKWFFLLYLTSNAIACNTATQYEEAIRIYQLILSIEPDYLWVKNELLPQSIKKQDNEYLKNRKEKVEKKL